MDVTAAPLEVPADDAELVRRARAGDKAAFAALFVRHRPVALALALGALGRADLAGDAVQEAALAALLNLDRLRRPDRFGPWLCGIALNVARRWLRAESRGKAHLGRLATLDRDGVDPRPTPEERALDGELATALQRALAGLPPGQRAAVRLFYLEELSGGEVADVLATTTGAVKSRLHKARVSLRRQLIAYQEVPMPVPALPHPVPMRVIDVRRQIAEHDAPRRHVIILEDALGTHHLPIYVGQAEATALALELTGTELPRPMTYGFVQRVVSALGGTLTGVRITRLTDQTFYAEATFDGPGGPTAVDARPSDAINLALLADVPIHVDAGVLEQCVRRGHHVISDSDYPDGADRIAAETIALMP